MKNVLVLPVSVITILVVVIAMYLGGCGPQVTDEQLGLIQQSVSVLEEEVQANRMDLITVESPVERAKLEVAIDAQLKQIRILKTALSKAETLSDAKWYTGEAIVGVIGGFFPPALLALPWIRALRRQRTAIFDSIKAGGGPAMPEAAKAALASDPQAHKAFKKWKNGNRTLTPSMP